MSIKFKKRKPTTTELVSILEKGGTTKKPSDKKVEKGNQQIPRGKFSAHQNNSPCIVNGKLIEECAKGMRSSFLLREGFKPEQLDDMGFYGNAWDYGKNLVQRGGKDISRADVDKSLAAAKSDRQRYDILRKSGIKDYSNIKPGDIITMSWGASPNKMSSHLKDNINLWNQGKIDLPNTHIGYVTEKNGKLYVDHNVHGKWKSDPIDQVFNQNRSGNQVVIPLRVTRPNYENSTSDIAAASMLPDFGSVGKTLSGWGETISKSIDNAGISVGRKIEDFFSGLKFKDGGALKYQNPAGPIPYKNVKQENKKPVDFFFERQSPELKPQYLIDTLPAHVNSKDKTANEYLSVLQNPYFMEKYMKETNIDPETYRRYADYAIATAINESDMGNNWLLPLDNLLGDSKGMIQFNWNANVKNNPEFAKTLASFGITESNYTTPENQAKLFMLFAPKVVEGGNESYMQGLNADKSKKLKRTIPVNPVTQEPISATLPGGKIVRKVLSTLGSEKQTEESVSGNTPNMKPEEIFRRMYRGGRDLREGRATYKHEDDKYKSDNIEVRKFMDQLGKIKSKVYQPKLKRGGELNQGSKPMEFVLSKSGTVTDHTLDGYELVNGKLQSNKKSSVKGYLRPLDPSKIKEMNQYGENLYSKMQKGGTTKDQQFESWLATTPDNLRFTNSEDYDMRLWWETLGKPKTWEQAVRENNLQPDEEDGLYHGSSRDPKTGRLIKRLDHNTLRHAIESDAKEGYMLFSDDEGALYTLNEYEFKNSPLKNKLLRTQFLPEVEVKAKRFENGGLIFKKGGSVRDMPCNKPKRTPDHKTKSHVVKACEGGKEKVIRFGQQGVSGSPKKKGESESYRKRRESFKARHSKNIAKGKMSAAYWANKVKW